MPTAMAAYNRKMTLVARGILLVASQICGPKLDLE
jgi:hypothetical protein